MKQLLLTIFILISLYSFSQDNPDCYTEKLFIILLSTKDYDVAKRFISDLSQKSDFEIKRDGLTPNDRFGLTFPREVCEPDWLEYPCYIARGRYDDGIYLSIEFSNAYESFSKGYYIVIGASGYNDISESLDNFKQYVSDAYLKKTRVYMCCYH